MVKLHRISLKKAREKALPILLSGYKKRNKIRSNSEEALRNPEKLARDRHSSAKPHLSTI
jgi:hypothetical protein